jgi:hypothetical protein
VRAVTSAALTDLLPAGAARANDRVTCRVTVSDLKSLGPASMAARFVEER